MKVLLTDEQHIEAMHGHSGASALCERHFLYVENGS
jgi:hypothetical protein